MRHAVFYSIFLEKRRRARYSVEARRGHLVESTLKAQDDEKLAVDRVKEKEIELLEKQKEIEELKQSTVIMVDIR